MLSRMISIILMAGAVCSAAAQPEGSPAALYVLPGSRLFIEGRSNVNSFKYEYEALPENDSETLDLGLICCVVSQLHRDDLELDLSKFDSGNSRMNRDFRNLLHADKHPRIVITIEELMALDDAGERVDLLADGISQVWVRASFTIAGVKRLDVFPVEVRHREDVNKMRLTGGLTVNILDYGLKPPRALMGMIKVDRNIRISFDLILGLTHEPVLAGESDHEYAQCAFVSDGSK